MALVVSDPRGTSRTGVPGSDLSTVRSELHRWSHLETERREDLPTSTLSQKGSRTRRCDPHENTEIKVVPEEL